MNENIVKTGVYVNANGEDCQFNFVTSIGAVDKIRFVNFVIDTLIEDNDGNTSRRYYHHVIKDLIFDFAIAYVFTDIDLSEIMQPEGSEDESSDSAINKIENFVNNTNAVDIVKVNADTGVMSKLYEAVDLNLEYRTGIHSNPIAESLSKLFNTIEKKVGDFDIEGISEFAQKMSGISGELTTEKMLDAYANSDMYKENLNKVVADKKKNNISVISEFPKQYLSPTDEIINSFVESKNDTSE